MIDPELRERLAPLSWLGGLLLAAVLLYVAFNVWPAKATELGLDNNQRPFEAFVLGTAHNPYPYSTTSQSNLHAAFGSRTRAVWAVCTTACYIATGTSPATANGARFQLPANTIAQLRVSANTSIRALAVSSSGQLSIVELE